MGIASLAMYVEPGELKQAHEDLWAGIRDRLRSAGFAAPDSLDWIISYDEAWLDPRLVLAQTCGLPLVGSLAGRVRLVATPTYSFPCAEGDQRASVVTVRRDFAGQDIEDLRGRTAAINELESNSGTNLLRALVAPHARGGRFFGSVMTTGDHLVSIERVNSGAVDVAAIDSVTYGHVARYAPDMIRDIRILCLTPAGPGLPFITRRDAPDDEVEALRIAITETIADPSLKSAVDLIGIDGVTFPDESDYAILARYKQEAEALGYPVVA